MNLLNYIKGLRKGKEARRIEIDAMTDPFLSEAIEGYDTVKGDHIARIAQMQQAIAARSKTTKNTLWISYVSAAAVLLGVVFFTVFNNSDDELTDSDVLYVYVPEAYIEMKKMEVAKTNEINAIAEIKNLDIISPDEEIDIYIPQEYVEQKKTDISRNKALKRENQIIEKTTTVITNIDEIFVPEEAIEIYIPSDYTEKERSTTLPRVNVENADNY